MDKITPIRPGVRLGRPEPQLPRFSPRDLAMARRQRAELRATRQRKRPVRGATLVAFGAGFLTARLLDLALSLLH